MGRAPRAPPTFRRALAARPRVVRVSNITEARIEAAAALRELVHAFSGHDADEETLKTVASEARALLPSLERAPRRTRAIPSFDAIVRGVPEPGQRPTYAMADRAVVFAMANPTPEVAPEEVEGVAEVIATGRSDYPNQINNVLAFPGVFRGVLDVRATVTGTVADPQAVGDGTVRDGLVRLAAYPEALRQIQAAFTMSPAVSPRCRTCWADASPWRTFPTTPLPART